MRVDGVYSKLEMDGLPLTFFSLLFYLTCDSKRYL